MTKPATTMLAGTFEVRSWTEEEWPAAGEAVTGDREETLVVVHDHAPPHAIRIAAAPAVHIEGSRKVGLTVGAGFRPAGTEDGCEL